MNKNLVLRIVKEIIEEELDNIEEVSTSSAEPGYASPYAFQGNDELAKKRRKHTAGEAGMSIVDKDADPKADPLYEKYKTR